MTAVSFSIPDEVSEAFNRAFDGVDQNNVIADLMRKAVADLEQQAQRQETFRLLTERRAMRPTLTDDDIRSARMEGRQ